MTCRTVRLHPVIVAQAAATSQELMGGRFGLGVGSGEALNEHILGDHWPPVDTRLDMLEEAIAVIREMWKAAWSPTTASTTWWRTPDIYTLPETLPEILVSGFGPKAISLAAKVADGFMTTMPNAEDLQSYREQGGVGRTQGGLKVCWAASVDEARSSVHRMWRNMFVPGQHSQDLPLPRHFDQAASLVSEDMVTGLPLGPDPEEHIKAVSEYIDAGFDEVYVAQIGPDQAGMIDFYERVALRHVR